MTSIRPMSDTLVLDHAFLAINLVPWEDAITLWYEGVAEIIESHAGDVIRSPSIEMEKPSIIRVVKPHKRRPRPVRFSRQAVFVRDDGKCAYCGRDVSFGEATFDHVVPRCQGGQTKWDNVTIACEACNKRKGGRTPEEAGMHLRVIPVKPKNLSGLVARKLSWRPGMPESWKPYLPMRRLGLAI